MKLKSDKVKLKSDKVKLKGNKETLTTNNVSALKTKFRAYGVGRKFKLPVIRVTAFYWFIYHWYLVIKCRLSRTVSRVVLGGIQENIIK